MYIEKRGFHFIIYRFLIFPVEFSKFVFCILLPGSAFQQLFNAHGNRMSSVDMHKGQTYVHSLVCMFIYTTMHITIIWIYLNLQASGQIGQWITKRLWCRYVNVYECGINGEIDTIEIQADRNTRFDICNG